MPSTIKLSISVPAQLLRQAERTLAQPGETRSAMLSRVLAAAVERALDEQYAEGYRRQPVTSEEDAFTEAAARQGFADSRAKQRTARVPTGRKRATG